MADHDFHCVSKSFCNINTVMDRKKTIIGMLALFAGAGFANAEVIYVTNSSSSTVTEYSAAGAVLASRPTGGNLNTVAADAAGNLYVTDLNSGVIEFAGGSPSSSDATLPTTGTSSFYFGAAVDSSGNVYFSTDADSGSSSDIKIFRYTNITQPPVLFSDTAPATSFGVRNSVAVDPVSGNVFLADNANSKILEYNTGGALINTFTNGVSSPRSIAVDNAGDLYVSNGGTSSLVKIVIATGINSNVATGLSSPTGVAVDLQNNVYELQLNGSSHYGMYEFTSTGAPLGQIFDTGSTEGDFIAVTPEPSTFAIFPLALSAILLGYRRRKSAR
jgi:hypothetical protein